MVGSDTATIFESSMISEETNEVDSKIPRCALALFSSSLEEAAIPLSRLRHLQGVPSIRSLREALAKSTHGHAFRSPLLVSSRPELRS